LNAFAPPSPSESDGPFEWTSHHHHQQEMPPSPDSTFSGRGRAREFDAKKVFEETLSQPQFMSFLEATIAFHPEDRRHLWLCDPDDDPALTGKETLEKELHVNLQEYAFLDYL
jgi:hypothetical protein